MGEEEDSPQSSEGGLVQMGLLSAGVEAQLGPPRAPVPTPVPVRWLQNITWNPGGKDTSSQSWTGSEVSVETPQ